MTTFYAEFRWSLPREAATVALFAERVSVRSGHPCVWRAGVSRSDASRLDATLSFPRASPMNLMTLSDEICILDFEPVPFFWIHSMACLVEMGGVVHNARPLVRGSQGAPLWRDLRWSDRLRIRIGQGHRVRL